VVEDDVVGGKSRGRVYGTRDLTANSRHGASSLTHPLVLTCNIDHDYQLAEKAQLKQQILQVNAKANRVDQRSAQLKEKVRLMQQQVAMMMEKHVADTSTSTSQVHPNYPKTLMITMFLDYHFYCKLNYLLIYVLYSISINIIFISF